MSNINHRFIVSGGGTGGHIFPAISIAEGLRRRFPDSEILFVGAMGKMEMEKVPAAGFPIVGLPVAGFHRGEIWRNLLFLPKLLASLWKASSVVRKFRPDCVIGVGGYASGPVLRVATQMGIPTLLQEQNSYAGVTNKLLGRKASKICVAYRNMERFFPAEKIVFTGNPIRKGLSGIVGVAEFLWIRPVAAGRSGGGGQSGRPHAEQRHPRQDGADTRLRGTVSLAERQNILP